MTITAREILSRLPLDSGGAIAELNAMIVVREEF
jgi:hypothetical protein